MPDDPLGLTPNSIMPAFWRYPTEAAILGRLLAGYGELEYDLHTCLAVTTGNSEQALRTIFTKRGEKGRIDLADTLLRQPFRKIGLSKQFRTGINAMHWCRDCRNQYSHCHWHDDRSGLFFLNLEVSAHDTSTPLKHQLFNIDLPLLQKQEAYFRHTQRWFTFLSMEYRKRAGKIRTHAHTEPPPLSQPMLHNPADTHPPPQIG